MKCKKVGHFAKVCKTKEKDTNRPKKGNIHQVTKDDDFAFTLQPSGRDIPTIDIELEGVRLEGVLVDSGSTCNVIDRATWEMLKEKKVKCVLRKSKRMLYSYGSNEPLTTAGEFELNFVTKINVAMCVLLLWKRKQGQYLAGRPQKSWPY